jgi:O-antigen/teichoic acid export membrane protein
MIADQEQIEDETAAKHFATNHLKGDLARRSVQSGVLTLSSQALKFVLSIGSMIVLARLLTPVDYGVVGMVAIVLNFAVMFQYLGLARATVQWPELNHPQVSNLFWVNVGLSTVIALLLAGISPLISSFFDEPRVIPVTIGYALCIFVTGLWIQHEALLVRQMRFAVLTAVDLVSLVVGLSVAIVAASRGAGYWALVYNQITVTTIRACGFWFACKWRPGLPSRGSGIRPILSFGGHLTASNLMNFFSRNLDNILIGKYWGVQQLGLYSRSYQLLLVPLEQVLEPIGAVAIPALSRLSEEPDNYRKAYLSTLEKIAMITMPGITLMCATSDWLVLVLLGPQWAESAQIFMFLGIAAVVQPITRTCPWLLSTQGRTRELFTWSLIAAAISMSSICIGLSWGAMGVAASYAIFDFCLYTPLVLWYTGRKGPVRTRDFYRILAPSICASIASLVVLLIARGWLSAVNPLLIRIAIALVLTIVISVLVFVIIPAGRVALQGFKDLIMLAIRPKRSGASPAE